MKSRPTTRCRPTVELAESRALMATFTPAIGVGAAVGPFLVTAKTPGKLDIYISSARLADGQTFRPFADIDTGNVKVNGTFYLDVAIRRDAVDRNGDGLKDAILTVTPRSALKLNPATTSLTIRGRTEKGDVWVGSAPITVVTGLGAIAGRSTLPAGAQLDFSNPTNFSNALISDNQLYILILQTTDNNLTLYPFNSTTRQPVTSNPIWTAKIAGKGATTVVMQNTDGNLVAYTPAMAPVWQTHTGSVANAGAYAVLTNDGHLQVYKDGVLLYTT